MLDASEALDVYLGDLEHLGGRIGLDYGNRVFRLKFYECLPLGLHEWTVSQENTYSGDFTVFGTGWR